MAAHAVHHDEQRRAVAGCDRGAILVVFAIAGQADVGELDLPRASRQSAAPARLLNCRAAYISGPRRTPGIRIQMLRSMTGFARSERTTAAGVLAWEIRSVNHRYLEVGLRLPEELRGAEAEFRQRDRRGGAPRQGGRDALPAARPPPAGRELELDEDLLDRLVEGALAVQRRLGADGRIDAVDLLRWPGVVSEAERDAAPLAAAARRTARRSAGGVHRVARERGRAHRRDARDARPGRAEDRRSRSPPGCPKCRRASARGCRSASAPSTAEGNPERLEQEVAILLQKMDVAEELDRLQQPRRGDDSTRSPPARRSAASSIS